MYHTVAREILLKAYFISWSLVSLLAPLIKIKKKKKEEHKSNLISEQHYYRLFSYLVFKSSMHHGVTPRQLNKLEDH